MSRFTLIIAIWLLLLGEIGDAALAGTTSRISLLLLYVAVTALTGIAVAIVLGEDGASPDARRGTACRALPRDLESR